VKHLMHYARQLGQRRMTAFYLLPQGVPEDGETSQLRLSSLPRRADRPRTAREMWAEAEAESEDEPDEEAGR